MRRLLSRTAIDIRVVALIGRCVSVLALIVGCAGNRSAPDATRAPAPTVHASSFQPGRRTLLDAHNAYPERGQWADRITRALSTGTPLAIEQDLYWHRDERTGQFAIVVAHDDDALVGAPTLERHFFETIRPYMERALRDGRRDEWPLITLNLDFKTDEPAHHDAVWALLGKYEAWLTTVPRTANEGVLEPLTLGPLLVLTGSDSGQRKRFYDVVPIGQHLRAFGARPIPPPFGTSRAARAHDQVVTAARSLIRRHASNYERWVNFAWTRVEEGGAAEAGPWAAADARRLAQLVQRAHEQGFWIRFYTLDGFVKADDGGYTASYNFGNADAAAVRWAAVLDTRVDFVATDQYELFSALRDRLRKERSHP